MQGMQIQNLIKNQNIEGKTSKNASIVPGKGEVQAEQGGVDFATLFGEVNQNQSNPLVNINGEKKSALLENSVAKTNTNLDQLLNNLKGTSDVDGGEDEASNIQGEKKTFFPNQKNQKMIEGKSENSESPLDFLVRNTKNKNVSDASIHESGLKNEVTMEGKEEKKSFFPQANKIPNNIVSSQNKAEPALSDIEQKLRLVSGEDYVGVKNKLPEKKSSEGQLHELLGNKKEIDISDLVKNTKNTPNKMMGEYQKGQNILSDNVIRSPKDLAFKETKKTKHDSIDELKTSELKKTNELSNIKESPIQLMTNKEQGQQNLKSNENVKILDLNKMNTSNTNQIIEKITDYVMQNKVASKDSLDLIVKHDSLGQFQIQVNKVPNQNQVDMQIITSSHEGHKFFAENESALAKSLQQSGIQLSDLRIVSSMNEVGLNSMGESKQFSSFSQNQNGFSQQHSSFESFQGGDFRQGSDRRKELWNEYREKFGA